ncbi:class I SAM-dependent methyltransferase [Marinilongibacter aquaticus]|uniref:class I SAM-dependent methyltransferase n=1 Tax=Marinilongibacter aquaticus TaxID=2975157 RepID=UPI0021BD9C81|nr:class I SAM-dependent methyltransferase [Marinilongibacter aquaticus]UBM59634.1 class I SAM-dependent methyltransferase [Marinilongibacter aquaticus]
MAFQRKHRFYMAEFWETNFQEKQTMWGLDPAESAISTAALFQSKGIEKVLIPGFGYGRNAMAFIEKGMELVGIEISETAIQLARKHYEERLKVYCGSVCDMPFDNAQYGGIFCYALIHLLDEAERAKLIRDCYAQLQAGGSMVFVAISTETPNYGQGEPLGPNRFRSRHGVNLFYYDKSAIDKEFGPFGLVKAVEIDEPSIAMGPKPSQRFWEIHCEKK